HVGAAEKLDRIPVLGRTFPEVDLPEVGGELGLLIAATGDVGMRRNHFAPRLEGSGDGAFDRVPGLLLLLVPYLLVEPEPEELHLHLLDLVGLARRNGGEQARRAVEGAIGVVGTKRFLVGPTVPDVP